MEFIEKQKVLEKINGYGGCDATDACDRHCDDAFASLYYEIEGMESVEKNSEVVNNCIGCLHNNQDAPECMHCSRAYSDCYEEVKTD